MLRIGHLHIVFDIFIIFRETLELFLKEFTNEFVQISIDATEVVTHFLGHILHLLLC